MKVFLLFIVIAMACGICYGVSYNYYTSSGTIRSPNYPSSYPNGIDYSWNIHAPTGTNYIRFTFSTFSLEAYRSCGYDYVQIYGTTNELKSYATKYCGSSLPNVRTIQGRYATVYFHTDSSNTDTGFSLTWSSSTSQSFVNYLTGTSGIITSPNYPLNYDNNYYHTWSITADSRTTSIQFTFIDFETEACKDYIQIYKTSRTAYTQKLCGSSTPDPVTISGRYAKLYFYTDQSVTQKGFSVSWRAQNTVQPTTLYGSTTYLRGNSGTLTSPNYPLNYANNYRHTWSITADAGTTSIKFTFIDFETESCNDYVKIYDGSVSTSSYTFSSARKLCGSSTPYPVTISGRYAKLYFYTDQSVTHKGFSVTWIASIASITRSYGTVSVAGIAGGASGGLFLLVAIILAVIFCKVRSSRAHQQRSTVLTTRNVQQPQQVVVSTQQTGNTGTMYTPYPPPYTPPQHGYINPTFPPDVHGGTPYHGTPSVDMTTAPPMMPLPIPLQHNEKDSQMKYN